MAVDTAEKRFSMIVFGAAWAHGLLPVPDGSDMDSDDQRQFVLGAYSGVGWGSGGIGAQVPAYYGSGGAAFDADGKMLTMFLAEGEDVPADAQFIAGVAYDMESGARFICPWPASGVVHYPAGVASAAVRSDGAMTFTTGDVDREDSVFGFSERGELCVTNNAPTNEAGGFAFVGNKLCVTEIN